MTAPLDGARELIADLEAQERRGVLASSAKAQAVDHDLDVLDARELADGWTTATDAAATKPEPRRCSTRSPRCAKASPVRRWGRAGPMTSMEVPTPAPVEVPSQPAEPATPAVPGEPATPAVPTEPVTPIDPTPPEQPDTPEEPSPVPTQPDPEPPPDTAPDPG